MWFVGFVLWFLLPAQAGQILDSQAWFLEVPSYIEENFQAYPLGPTASGQQFIGFTAALESGHQLEFIGFSSDTALCATDNGMTQTKLRFSLSQSGRYVAFVPQSLSFTGELCGYSNGVLMECLPVNASYDRAFYGVRFSYVVDTVVFNALAPDSICTGVVYTQSQLEDTAVVPQETAFPQDTEETDLQPDTDTIQDTEHTDDPPVDSDSTQDSTDTDASQDSDVPEDSVDTAIPGDSDPQDSATDSVVSIDTDPPTDSADSDDPQDSEIPQDSVDTDVQDESDTPPAETDLPIETDLPVETDSLMDTDVPEDSNPTRDTEDSDVSSQDSAVDSVDTDVNDETDDSGDSNPLDDSDVTRDSVVFIETDAPQDTEDSDVIPVESDSLIESDSEPEADSYLPIESDTQVDDTDIPVDSYQVDTDSPADTDVPVDTYREVYIPDDTDDSNGGGGEGITIPDFIGGDKDPGLGGYFGGCLCSSNQRPSFGWIGLLAALVLRRRKN